MTISRLALGMLGIALMARAPMLRAQSSSNVASASDPRLTYVPPAAPLFVERYADALGVAYSPESDRLAALKLLLAKARVQARSRTAPVAYAARDTILCPMPVVVIDPRQLAPMPSVAIDTTVVRGAPAAGRLIGCTNPLAP